MKEYDELIKKIDIADQVNKEIGGNFGRTMTITMGEALMVKHLLEKQANCVATSHETALRKHTVMPSLLEIDFNKMRKEKGLTLREVEKSTGISNAYLSQLETGKIKSPGYNTVKSLLELYSNKA